MNSTDYSSFDYFVKGEVDGGRSMAVQLRLHDKDFERLFSEAEDSGRSYGEVMDSFFNYLFSNLEDSSVKLPMRDVNDAYHEISSCFCRAIEDAFESVGADLKEKQNLDLPMWLRLK